MALKIKFNYNASWSLTLKKLEKLMLCSDIELHYIGGEVAESKYTVNTSLPISTIKEKEIIDILKFSTYRPEEAQSLSHILILEPNPVVFDGEMQFREKCQPNTQPTPIFSM